MDLFSDPFELTGSSDSFPSLLINPASGLPMIGGIAGVDVAGNPYGFDDGLFREPIESDFPEP